MAKVNHKYFEYLLNCEKDLSYFFTDLVWPLCTDDPFRKSPYGFDLMVDYAKAWINKEKPNLIVCLPPRNGKSKFFSVAVPLYLWIVNNSTRIINVSSTPEVLEDFALDRKRVFSSSDYKKLCPSRIVKDKEGRVENESGGYFVHWTILNTVIGIGGDYIIVDDPITTKNAFNKNHCNKVFREFTGGLLSRRNSKDINNPSPVLITMQRLSDYDLAGEMKERGFEYLELQAYAEEKQYFIFPTTGKVWERPELDVLNPELESLETLFSLRLTVENFQAQYQQRPIVSSGAYISKEVLVYYDELSEYTRTFISIDPASSVSDEACNWGFVIIGEHSTMEGLRYDVLYAHGHKYEYPSGKMKTIELIDYWKVDLIIVENKSAGVALLPELEALYPNKVIKIDPKGSKQDRTLTSLPRISQGIVRFPNLRVFPHCVWMTLLLYEVLAFPKGKTDDILDALSQFINTMIKARLTVQQFYGALKG
jgi:phage terminase large subunit-like protein